jgi:hypothetical protein
MSSYSSLSRLHRCEREYILNKQFRDTKEDSKALIFGKAYHSSIELGIDKGIEVLKEFELHGMIPLLLEMVTRFKKFIKSNDIEIIQNEIKFEMNLDGEPYIGYIDGLAKMGDKYYLLELKTASRIAYSHVGIDSQLTSYLDAYRKCDSFKLNAGYEDEGDPIEIEKSFEIDGILWISNAKKKDGEPVVTKSGDLSVAKTQSCSYGKYLNAVYDIYGKLEDSPEKVQTFCKWLEENDNPLIVMAVTNRTERQMDEFSERIKPLLEREKHLNKLLREGGFINALRKCISFPGQFCMQTCRYSEQCVQAFNDEALEINLDDLEEIK